MLKPGVEKAIENFYNEYYKKNFTLNGKILLISVKKLWINNMPVGPGGHQTKEIGELSSSQQDIYARFEYFFGSVNAYMPSEEN